MKRSQQLDMKDTVFFEKQLQFVSSKMYQKKYAELKIANGSLFALTSEIDPGAESYVYRMYDQVGMAKIISNYADDLPVSDVKGTEVVGKIKSIGAAYQYSNKEVKSARMAGVPLQSMKATAARTSIEQRINRLGWYGDADFGLVGVLSHPNIPVLNLVNPVITDPTLSADEIYDAVAGWLIRISEETKGIEIPNTAVFPLNAFNVLSSVRLNQYSDNSILDVLKKNFPYITKWDWAVELEQVDPRPSGTAGSAPCAIIYNRDPEKARIEIPLRLETLPPERRNLATIVNMESIFAGFITNYPVSLLIVENC